MGIKFFEIYRMRRGVVAFPTDSGMQVHLFVERLINNIVSKSEILKEGI